MNVRPCLECCRESKMAEARVDAGEVRDRCLRFGLLLGYSCKRKFINLMFP